MPRIHPFAAAAAFVVLLGAFASAELWVGTRTTSAAIVLFAVFLAAVQTCAGWLALRAGGLDDMQARLPAAFCVGFACLSVPMYAISSLLDVSALVALLACAAIVGVMGLVFGRRGTVLPREQGADLADIGIALLLAGAIVVLTRTPVAAVRALEASGNLPIWSDYFLHGVTIASFGGPFMDGTELELPGVSRVFYHYAPFLIPAAFQSVSGLPGLALATSVLLPWGLLVAAMGCYAFTTQIGGRAAGMLAVIAIAAIPAYRFPLPSGLFDFYWMLLASPGGGCAIGIVMVVCAAALSFVERGGARTFWFIWLLMLSIILVRVQFFMLAAPAVAVYASLRHPWMRKRAVWIGLSAAAIVVLVALLSIRPIRDWLMTTSNPVDYMDSVLRFTLWRGEPALFGRQPLALMVVAKVAVILVAILGAYVLVYPALALAVHRRFGLRRADLMVPLVVLSFIGLTLLAPMAGNGDITEYKQRHFPLVYVVVVVYSVAYVWRLVAARAGDSRALYPGAGLLAVVVLAAAAFASRGQNPSRPDLVAMPWAVDFHNQRVAPGLLAAADYMRVRSVSGDILAMAGDAPNGQSPVLVDFVSITGIPVFLTRSELRMLRGGCVAKTVEMRAEALKRIALAADWPEARRLMRDNAIRWFVEPAGSSPRWDPARQAAAFSSEGMSVYDAGVRDIGARPPTQDCK